MVTTERSFSPSINLTRDIGRELAYVATANAQRVYQQILSDYAVGIHSFSLIGSYGTGKSSFLVALEQTLSQGTPHFAPPNGHFGGASHFEFINIVGGYASLAQALATNLNAPSAAELWPALDARCAEARQRDSCLMIVIDEFGKFLEYAAQKNPEQELYFIQQLAEYVNAPGQNAALLVTLHQNFSAYAYGLERKQREEWEKVKGRLKELTFNEPVEQLLELAASHINGAAANYRGDGVDQLVKVIGDSRAFPHRGQLGVEFAARLLPIDLLAASVLTQALQRYGQNERSLFTFLNANEPFGLSDFDAKRNRLFNLVCVYDYLAHNFDSLLASIHNPHYARWGAIRRAIERVEGEFHDQVQDARNLVKIVGLLNIFAPQGARIDAAFLRDYAVLTLGMAEVDALLQELETHKILRFVRFRETFVLFDGTDLNIDLALLEAGNKVEPIRDITQALRKYFTFPIVLAKAVSYQTGTPRYFGYQLSAAPLLALPEDAAVDGAINLVFSETLTEAEVLAASHSQPPLTLICWYRSTGQIRDLLFDIAKTSYVIAANESDKVAVRELQQLRAHQIDNLNQQVLHGMYSQDGAVLWAWQGTAQAIDGQAALNTLLSTTCRKVFTATPVLRNELVNRHNVSSAVATARKAYFKALVEHWAEADLGFAPEKYPPEKTIYLTLLKQTGIHQCQDGQWCLDAPTAASFAGLWQYGETFLAQARVAPKNVADFCDGLRQAPFGLKPGLIDFWAPTFLFARREAYALYREDRFQPTLTAETLDLIRLAPHKYQVKSFSVDGIRLSFFNRFRALIQHKDEASQIQQNGLLATIAPFITFYNALPAYARQTQRLAAPTLRLRTAIANAKDPEHTFFEEFPRALGFPHIADEPAGDAEIAAYMNQLQASVHDLQSCFDQLVDRVELLLLDILGLTGEHFPGYKVAIAARFANLQEFLLLPRQRTLYVRLKSPLEDRTAWLGAVVQGVVGRDIKQLSDEDEQGIAVRLREAIQELDNLCELDTLTVDPENEASAVRVEITAYGEESRKLLQRLPKQKEDAVVALQAKLKLALSDDDAVNMAAVIRLLQEMTAHG
jgi:hypothetical protein